MKRCNCFGKIYNNEDTVKGVLFCMTEMLSVLCESLKCEQL